MGIHSGNHFSKAKNCDISFLDFDDEDWHRATENEKKKEM